MSKAVTSIRAVGVFLGHLLTATVGTKIIDDEVDSIFHPGGYGNGLLVHDFLDAIIAFGLGYLVFYKSRSVQAKWVWLAGTCWFGLRAFHVLAGIHGTLFVEMSGNGRPDVESFYVWSIFTLQFIRTGFYSFGAHICARVQNRVSLWPKNGPPPQPDDGLSLNK